MVKYEPSPPLASEGCMVHGSHGATGASHAQAWLPSTRLQDENEPLAASCAQFECVYWATHTMPMSSQSSSHECMAPPLVVKWHSPSEASLGHCVHVPPWYDPAPMLDGIPRRYASAQPPSGTSQSPPL